MENHPVFLGLLWKKASKVLLERQHSSLLDQLQYLELHATAEPVWR